MLTSVPFDILTEDRVSITATLHAAELPARARATAPLIGIINAGAGIPAAYYERFAGFLADRGIPTLTYDYRGIGRSRPPSLKGFEASVEQWGSQDCVAVLKWAMERFPTARRAVIGHSVGGLVTGFIPDAGLVNHLVFIGGHTGYWGDYAARARPGMWLLWHALMPAVTRLVGYFPARRLGLPEDLPAGVALEWANRRRPELWWNLCRSDGTLDQPRIDQLRGRFQAFRGRGLALSVTDDPFATAAATRRLCDLFQGVTFERQRWKPADLGLSKVGHFGFFRSRSRLTLWPQVADWLARASGSLERRA